MASIKRRAAAMKDTEHKRHRLADLLLVLLAALFCWCALQGTLDRNPQGIGMDSDLQNYAQIMEAGECPAAFARDPVASFCTSLPITSWGAACSAAPLWRPCFRS